MFLSAKPRPSKKARLNKPADDNVAAEPETTPDPEETDADAMLMIRHLKTMTSLPNKCKLTIPAMQTGQPAMSELMTNRLVQLRILINRQLHQRLLMTKMRTL